MRRVSIRKLSTFLLRGVDLVDPRQDPARQVAGVIAEGPRLGGYLAASAAHLAMNDYRLILGRRGGMVENLPRRNARLPRFRRSAARRLARSMCLAGSRRLSARSRTTRLKPLHSLNVAVNSRMVGRSPHTGHSSRESDLAQLHAQRRRSKPPDERITNAAMNLMAPWPESCR